MTKILLTFISLFITNISSAHVKPGTYEGTSKQGSLCAMTAGRTYFEGDIRHPLRERVEIQVQDTKFLVAHPSIIDSSSGDVSFDHGLFQAVNPTATGAIAIEIKMEHTANYEGPSSFVFMDSNWKTDQKNFYSCENLQWRRDWH